MWKNRILSKTIKIINYNHYKNALCSNYFVVLQSFMCYKGLKTTILKQELQHLSKTQQTVSIRIVVSTLCSSLLLGMFCSPVYASRVQERWTALKQDKRTLKKPSACSEG